jgi:predicted transcriptional regulator
MAEKQISVTAELPESLYEALVELAKKRGVSANTVLQQAIQSEQYLSQKEAEGAKILVEGSNNKLRRVIRK